MFVKYKIEDFGYLREKFTKFEIMQGNITETIVKEKELYDKIVCTVEKPIVGEYIVINAIYTGTDFRPEEIITSYKNYEEAERKFLESLNFVLLNICYDKDIDYNDKALYNNNNIDDIKNGCLKIFNTTLEEVIKNGIELFPLDYKGEMLSIYGKLQLVNINK